MTAQIMPLTVVADAPLHAIHEDDDATRGGGDGGDMRHDDAEQILQQLRDLSAHQARIHSRLDQLANQSGADHIELFGVGGNPGLSQQVSEMRATMRAIEREIEQAAKHATSMLDLALAQQDRLGESLRVEIRAMTASVADARLFLEQRGDAIADDLDAKLAIYDRAADKRVADLSTLVKDGHTHSRIRTGVAVFAGLSIGLWGLFAALELFQQVTGAR